MNADPGHASRKPGRPSSERRLDSRQALIDAARDLFARYEYDQVSTKRIADAAGVNPAMIRYHFEGKAGLLETAFDEALAPIIAKLNTLSTRGGDVDLEGVFGVYMRTMAANPWLPKMILRHVLPEGGRLQARAASRISTSVAPVVRGLVSRGQANEKLRAELDPLLTTISLVSLALFPFLAQALIKRVLDVELSGPLVPALVEHTATIFHCGAGADGVNHAA
ncbi:TetR/AcrR family transcriptional regulator [Candidatus Rariloculus sp.]|uniref:TetR/AcrR family transcriptional regulator n=1 Tax=Candidatus Rariloculus sp. TaxID=3101265 RepID=UPI003D116F70